MTKAKEHKPERLPRNLWAASLTSFLTDVSSEMVFNLLPLYLFNVLGVGTAAIGLIEGIAESSASLFKLLSGWLSDRLNARKGLAVFGYGLSALMKPLLGLAASWPLILVLRWLERLGKGIRTAPRDALVADSVTKERRGLAFGIHRTADTAGAAVGLIIAWWVLRQRTGTGFTLSAASFQTIALLSALPAGLAVLSLAVGARDVAPARETEAGHDQDKRPALKFSEFSPRFRWFLLAAAIFTLGNSADAFLILRAQNLGMAVDRVLLVLLLFNIIYALVSSPAGRLSDRIGRRVLLIGGWCFYALVYLGFALASRSWMVVALMAGYGLYYGLTEGAARALVADLVDDKRRGTAYGAYHTIVGVLALPASLLAGWLWQGGGNWPGFGPWAPFALGAVLALVAAVILAASQGGLRQNPKLEESLG